MSDIDSDDSVWNDSADDEKPKTKPKRAGRASARKAASKTKKIVQDMSDGDDIEVFSLKSSSLSDSSFGWEPKKKNVRGENTKRKGKISPTASKKKTSTKPKTAKSKRTGKVDERKEEVEIPQKKKLKIDQEAHKVQDEAVKKANQRGILTGITEKLARSQGSVLPPSLLRCNMTELSVKKKARKEQRIMFVFPGKLAILNEGICGTLEGISTNSPILNIHFPNVQGGDDKDIDESESKRLRLLGTVVYPQNDYLTIRCQNNGKQVFVEDTFDHMVVFHSYEWVKEKNGKTESIEERNDLTGMFKDTVPEIDWNDPPVMGVTNKSDLLDSEEENVEGESEAEEFIDEGSEKPLPKRISPSLYAKEIVDDDSEAEDGLNERSEQPLPKRNTPSRRASRKAVKYTDDLSSDEVSSC